jgi:AcrR family transcriptional regulator
MRTREERKERITRRREGQILNAALTVFVRKGFGEATIPDIAQEASVAVGTIYNYYQSKRELLVAVIKKVIITEPLLDLFKNIQETDYTAFLADVLKDRMNLIQKGENTRMLFLMGEVQRDPELKKLYIEQVIAPTMDRIEKFYESRAASGYFRPLDSSVITRAVGGMIMGLVILGVLEGEDSPLKRIPLEKLTAEITDLILSGIKGKED